MAIRGMIRFLTSESMRLWNTPPMITPIARSTTFPLKANALNSSRKVQAFSVAWLRVVLGSGSICDGFPWLRRLGNGPMLGGLAVSEYGARATTLRVIQLYPHGLGFASSKPEAAAKTPLHRGAECGLWYQPLRASVRRHRGRLIRACFGRSDRSAQGDRPTLRSIRPRRATCKTFDAARGGGSKRIAVA